MGWRTHTRGGRHSSAWRRSTEKPPCVLVSDAVRVLQKDLTAGLGVAAAPELAFSDGTSFCCTSKPRAIKHLVEQKNSPNTRPK